MIGSGTFCANYPEFLPIDPDLQQFQSDFQLCGETWLVGANSSAMGLCCQANPHHCISYKAFKAVNKEKEALSEGQLLRRNTERGQGYVVALALPEGGKQS